MMVEVLDSPTLTYLGGQCRQCEGTLRYSKSGRCVTCQLALVKRYDSRRRLDDFEEKMRGVWYEDEKL